MKDGNDAFELEDKFDAFRLAAIPGLIGCEQAVETAKGKAVAMLLDSSEKKESKEEWGSSLFGLEPLYGEDEPCSEWIVN